MATMEVPQKLKIELPYDSVIPLLDIHPKEMKSGSQRDICTSMFTAALFTIAKIWKQPWCPPTDKWIKKNGACTHTNTHTRWNIIQSLERIKSCHLQQHGWTSKVSC